MTSDAPGPGSAVEPDGDAVPEPEASPGPQLSSLSDLVGHGAWVGLLTGLVAGPVVPVAFLLAFSLFSGIAGAGVGADAEDIGSDAMFSVVWLFSPFGLIAVFVGALVGVLVGIVTALTVAWALRVESWAGWRGGNAFLAASGGLGGLLALAILLPIVSLGLPGAGLIITYVGALAPVTVIAAASMTLAQRKKLAHLRPTLAGGTATSGRGMTRAHALRGAGVVAAGLVALVLAEMGVLLPTSGWEATCYRYAVGSPAPSVYTAWPPQITCFGADAVELVPRGLYGLLAALAVVALILLVVGSARPSAVRERVRAIVSVAVTLGLVALTAYGALGPVAPVPPPPPLGSAPSAPSDPSDPYDPEPEPAPSAAAPLPSAEFPPPSTTFTPEGLVESLQVLVDDTFAAAGPIVDPAIPPEMQTFEVHNVVECVAGGESGQTATLQVGFDTADVTQSLDRARTLWDDYGYELYDVTTNAGGDALDPTLAVNARGTDPQPASQLQLRIYDGFLILDVTGLCVAG